MRRRSLVNILGLVVFVDSIGISLSTIGAAVLSSGGISDGIWLLVPIFNGVALVLSPILWAAQRRLAPQSSLLVCSLGRALLLLVMPLSGDVWWLAVNRMASGLLGAVLSLALTLASTGDKASKRKLFGLLLGGQSIATIFGSALSGWMVGSRPGITLTLVILGGLQLVFTVVIGTLLKGTAGEPRPEDVSQKKRAKGLGGLFGWVVEPATIVVFLQRLVFTSTIPAALIMATGVAGVGVAGASVVVRGVSEAASSLLISRLDLKLARHALFGASAVLTVAGIAVANLSPTWVIVSSVVLGLLSGLFRISTTEIFDSLNHWSVSQRSAANAATFGLSRVAGPILSALALSSWTWYCAACGALLGAATLVLCCLALRGANKTQDTAPSGAS
jgi:MFS family permease